MVLKNAPDKDKPVGPELPEEEERSALDVALEYKLPIGIGLLAIALVVLVVFVFRNLAESREAEAWSKTKRLREDAVQAIGMTPLMALRMRTSLEEVRSKALRELEAQTDEYADYSVHPWLLYFKARLYEKANRAADARDTLAEIAERYPDHAFTNPALGLAGDKPVVQEQRERLMARAAFIAKHGKPFSKRPQPKAGLSATLAVKGHGNIKLGFFPEVAPLHVANFIYLAREGYFDGMTFHRITNFCIQTGDPNSKDEDPKNDGEGGPGWKVEKEIRFNPALHIRGTLSAAAQSSRSGMPEPDSGSQFFICTTPAPYLDGKYTPYGEVLEGMDVVDKIAQVKTQGANEDEIPVDRPVDPIVIEKVTVEGDFSLPESRMPGKLAPEKKPAEEKPAKEGAAEKEPAGAAPEKKAKPDPAKKG